MKAGWRIVLVAAVAAAILGVLALTGALAPAASQVTVRREADLFSLGMTRMQETQSATFSLAAGDAIEVAVVHAGGEMALHIACGENVIYEGRNPQMGIFRVYIPADGDYVMTVTGRQAEGSVSFRALRSDDE